MMAAAGNSQAQIDALGERMDRGFAEIKEMLLRYEERLRMMETREASYSPVMTSRLDAAWRKLDSHDGELGKIARTTDTLETIGKWLLGIVTALIIALGVAVLNGRIELVVR